MTTDEHQYFTSIFLYAGSFLEKKIIYFCCKFNDDERIL
jgi:hypothetical protein